jgi:hypothetical protein
VAEPVDPRILFFDKDKKKKDDVVFSTAGEAFRYMAKTYPDETQYVAVAITRGLDGDAVLHWSYSLSDMEASWLAVSLIGSALGLTRITGKRE